MRLGRAGGALLGCLWLGCDAGERAGSPRGPTSGAAPFPLAGWNQKVDLGTDSPHRFSIPMARGDFLHLIAEQQKTDSLIRVLDPAGRRVLIEVDRPRDIEGLEELFWVAPADGRFILEISAWDPKSAASVTVRIAAFRRATPVDRDRARALAAFGKGWRLEKKPGRRDEAIAAYREAAALWRKADDGLREGWAWDQEGRIATGAEGLSRVRSGVANLERAATLYSRAKEAVPEAIALGRLGEAWIRLGDLAAAARCQERALALYREMGKFAEEAAGANTLALTQLRLGRIGEAFGNLNRAAEVDRDYGARLDLASVLVNRGVLYAAVGKPRRALDDHRRALALLRGSAGETQLRAAILTKVGDDLLDLGEPEESLAQYRAALDLRREAADANGVAVTLNSIGLAELARRRPAAALAPLREAATIFRLLGNRASRAVVLNHLGRTYERLGDLTRGREQFELALGITPENPFQPIAEDALFGRARLARRDGRLAEAERLMLRNLARSEALGDRIESSELRASLLASRREHFDFLVDLLAERHSREPDEGHDARAFAVHERSEARELYEILTAKRRSLDASAAARRAGLGERIDALDRLRRTGGADLDPNPVEQALGDLLFGYREAAAAGRAAPVERMPAVLDLAQIQEQLLDEDTLLLEIHLGAERSFLWAATRSARRLIELPARNKIERAAREVDRLLPDSRFEIREVAIRKAVGELSSMVLGPVADLLGRRRLVVVVSGVLGRVPFAALPRPEEHSTEPEPLLVDHDVVQLPSIAVLAALRRARHNQAPAGHLLALVADPVFSRRDPRFDPGEGGRNLGAQDAEPADSRTFERLRYAGREAETIAALAPPGEAFVASGLAASRERVAGGGLADFRILHFATHGLYSEEFPELSALALSSFDSAGRPVDGLLRAYEVAGLDLRADLVVLSACRTALGGGGEEGAGQRGLTEAFLQAGVPRVLVALWDVDDRATGELMRRFYRALLGEGLPPARALRQAQLSLRRQPRWRAPFYWAGFVLEGDWT